MDKVHWSVVAVFAIAKGVILGALAGIIISNGAISDFSKSLIVGIVSALVGVIGMVIVAWMTNRSDRERTEAMLRDIKRSQGLTRRAGDPETEEIK